MERQIQAAGAGALRGWAFYMVAIFQEWEDYFELYWDVEPLPLSYVQFDWTGSQFQMQKALDIKLLGIKAN